jgi:dihydrofolate reductase
MIISIIAAISERGVIGYRGVIPWDIPADRRRFRELTMGHPLIMGRKTYESIGRPLPGRRNIVLSRQPDYKAAGCVIYGSLDEALLACADCGEVFICGGEELYRNVLPLADNIFLTIVHADPEGDAFFPPITDDFIETERSDQTDGTSCTFIIYRRRGD